MECILSKLESNTVFWNLLCTLEYTERSLVQFKTLFFSYLILDQRMRSQEELLLATNFERQFISILLVAIEQLNCHRNYLINGKLVWNGSNLRILKDASDLRIKAVLAFCIIEVLI